MKVETLESIERIPLAVDYRRMYRANATIAIGDSVRAPSRIEFVLELSPLGSHEVTVSFLDKTDYPIVPAIRMLKEHISELDRSGRLP